MFTTKKVARAIKAACALGFVASTGLVSANAVAQESGAEEIEKISITGSRIIREEFSSSSPVAVFDESDLTASGMTNIDEFLKFIPAFTGFQLGQTTNNGGDGQRKVDMRGLGFERTLVLINGRRQIGDVNDDGAVDLNAIPFGMVKRIEVLKDGASTIYGTDAVAGVVNIILKDDFEGVEFTADYGTSTEHGDATNKRFSLVMGTASEKGSFTVALEYNKQEEMLQGDRDWANESLYSQLQEDGTFAAIGSGSSNSRRIRGIDGLSGNYIVDADSGEVRAFESTDVYNFAPVNALVTPNERWQLGFTGRYELSDTLTTYSEALFTKRTSQQRLAPDASFGVTSSYTSILTGESQWNDLVPASNPYNPFGDNADNSFGISGSDVRVNRRFEESGGRIFRQSADTYRMVFGLEGEITDDLFFDVSYTFAQTETLDETSNYHRFDKWEIAVTPELCEANPECAAAGVLNPFDVFGTITDEQMAFLTADSLKDSYFGQMGFFQASLSGSLGDLKGGAIGWAVGYEYREEEGRYSPDEFAAEGLTTGGASDPLEGKFSVDELYSEVYLPVLDNLAVDLSARYSSYDTSAGDTFNFKVGVDYSPTEEIKIRAGYGTGFRAPNISELNQQDDTGFPVVESLCEFADRRTDITDTIRDNCEALFANDDDVDYTGADGEFGFAWQSAYTTAAPETPLKPEESVTTTLGVIYNSASIEGLLVSVDYWDIEIENYIGSEDINNLMFACMDSVDFTAEACEAFGGAPYDFASNFIYPLDAEGDFGNLGTISTNGFDFNAQYTLEGDFGFASEISVIYASTYVMSREEDFPIAGKKELVGTADGFAVFPEWRHNVGLKFSSDDWYVRWDLTYISESDDLRRPAEITSDAVAEAMVYHDIVGAYTVNDMLSFTVGINNLLDEDPPYFHSAFNANTEPGVYDVIGRRIFAQAKVTF